MAVSKNNQGVQKLLYAMKKLIREVNDKEICNKLEILVSSEKEDIPAQMVKDLLESPLSFDASKVPEPYTQYVKHYIYMVKREERLNQKKEEQKMKKEIEKSKKQAIPSEKEIP
ncbi:MAG: hypothetical protein KatS3mg129_2263 [Leptospiraceae bacterium]|nr:MAG: hypothetical protein KatS3mg129_2263 [Leptospiraceae bacterium]